MANRPIFLDITELTANPLRTGIQRVEREIIRHWPDRSTLIPCRFDSPSRKFVSLPEAVLDILTSHAGQPGEAEKKLLLPHLTAGRPLPPHELSMRLFNPEVFFDPARAAAYSAICRQPQANVSWLLFDFLPFLRPQDYPPGTAKFCMPYLQALRDVPRVSFISRQTQIEYTNRIMRDPRKTGPYFPLGGDGLQMKKQSFNPERKGFAYIGTIEPRKNVAVILQAFEELWRRGLDVQLTVIGRLDSRSKHELPILKRLESEQRFKYLGHVDDGSVREVMRQVRATLFISAVEGFGIPPYESLSVGVPAIVSPGLPSIELLPPGGRIVLSQINPGAVVAAVEELLDDARVSQLWEEANRLVIPTWRDFSLKIAAWLAE